MALYSEQIHNIALSDIESGEYQPRKSFSVDDLAQNLAANELLQPIVIREISPGKYEIIAGERRYRAFKKLGKKYIPSIIRTTNDTETAAISLIENIQREKLCCIDEALQLEKIKIICGLNNSEVAQTLGKSRSWVSNRIRLLKLSDKAIDAIRNDFITATHGRLLVNLNWLEQNAMVSKIISENLSTEAALILIKNRVDSAKQSTKKTTIQKDVHIAHLENYLSEKINAQTIVNNDSIEINFHSKEQLIGILERNFKIPA